MGGAVSSGESNDELIDNLMESDYIKTTKVERVFRAVDRALYYTEAFKSNAYKDLAWKDGNLHLSAPCIYSVVLENLKLEKGTSFLNMGSGTGYFSTLCGLMIGKHGINHGIELHPEVAEYGRDKLEEFLSTSPAIDGFDFCMPEFVVGNCLNPISSSIRYERIYCGAACPEEMIRNVTDLLKIGGICVMPVNDSLMQITRLSETTSERKSLLPVSFATLIAPARAGTDKNKPVVLPKLNPLSLKELCRNEIRGIIRSGFMQPGSLRLQPSKDRKKRRNRRRQLRQEQRRRANRLLVVQRRQSAGDDGETGFVAVAYSLGNDNSSGDEYYDGAGLVVGNNADHEEDGMHVVLSPSSTDTDGAQSDDSDNEMPALEGENVAPASSSTSAPPAGAPSTSSASSSSVPIPPTRQPPPEQNHVVSPPQLHNYPPRPPLDENQVLPPNRFLGPNGTDTFLDRIRELYQRRENRAGGFRQLTGLINAVSAATPGFMRARAVAAANAARASASGTAPTAPTTSTSAGGASQENYDSSPGHWSSSLSSSTISTDETSSSSDNDSDEMDGRRINPNHLFGKNGHRNKPISGSAESGVVVTDSPPTKNDDDQEMGDHNDDQKKKKLRKRKKAGTHKTGRPIFPPPPEVYEEMERQRQQAEREEQEDAENAENEEEELDNTPAGRLKRNPISVQMRTRIGALPMLPPPVKLYLNFYRQLDDDNLA